MFRSPQIYLTEMYLQKSWKMLEFAQFCFRRVRELALSELRV